MICPKCKLDDNKVLDSRDMGQDERRRQRQCNQCLHRFSTVEMPVERRDKLQKDQKRLQSLVSLIDNARGADAWQESQG